jgi:hypothetical protein
MNMIRHDYVPANGPSMSITSGAPFINKNFSGLVTRQKFPAILSARCYEINRRINPDTSKSSQVLMHPSVVAEGVDLGNLRRVYRPRSATRGYSRTSSATRGHPHPPKCLDSFPLLMRKGQLLRCLINRHQEP